MSVRRKTNVRKTLIRECGKCGKTFVTSAASPWIRQMPRDGKEQAITYFCSQSCYDASYIHKFDGLEWKRRMERESKRDITAKNRKYYQNHKEQEKQRNRERYWANHEASLLSLRYNREKRKLIAAQEAAVGTERGAL